MFSDGKAGTLTAVEDVDSDEESSMLPGSKHFKRGLQKIEDRLIKPLMTPSQDVKM